MKGPSSLIPSAGRAALLVGLLASAVNASLALTSAEREVAGWIKSSNCLVRGSKPALARKNQKLIVGDQVRARSGSATVQVFGKMITLPAGADWYTVPKSEDEVVGGTDVFVKYTKPAGRSRGDGPTLEGVWRTEALLGLTDSEGSDALHVQIRVVPATEQGKSRTDPGKEPLILEDGDPFDIEVRNDSEVPLYFSVMDIDYAASVSMLSPQTDKSQSTMPPRSEWTRVPGQFRYWAGLADGWPEGLEHLKLFAATIPFDMSSLQTAGAKSRPPAEVASDDPLAFLIECATGAKSLVKVGHWTTAEATYITRPKK